MIDALWGDMRYHIDPRTTVTLADAAIAELEVENERLKKQLVKAYDSMAGLEARS